MRHEIELPDIWPRYDLHLIASDDVAGTVDRTHSALPALAAELAAKPPVIISGAP